MKNRIKGIHHAIYPYCPKHEAQNNICFPNEYYMNIICNIIRGQKIESRHQVYAVALDEDGEIILSIGESDYSTYIRSALKPFQASAAIISGATAAAGFISEEIALMCASHNGEKIHVQTAKDMANKLGLNIAHYECGSHPPHDKKAREAAKKTKMGFTPFHNNCSGKHSGMLSLAKKLGVNPRGYTEMNHPVQQVIFQQLTKLIGTNHFPYGIDGCSAPTPFLSLHTIAKLFQTLGSGKYPELTEAYSAMSKHPYLIGGHNRFDTEFISALNNKGICKAGGEAIRGIVLKTKRYGLTGIALKVLDGNQRAIEVATMAILNHLDVLNIQEKEDLLKYETTPLYNHRKIHVGDIKAEINN